MPFRSDLVYVLPSELDLLADWFGAVKLFMINKFSICCR